jgi:hypothetical protein
MGIDGSVKNDQFARQCSSHPLIELEPALVHMQRFKGFQGGVLELEQQKALTLTLLMWRIW